MRRTLAQMTVGAALASGLVCLPLQHAGADGETCDGLPATIVITAAVGVAEGTPGDDVIVANPTNGSTGQVPPGVTNLEVFGEGGDDTICIVGDRYALAYGGPGDDTLRVQPGTTGLLDGGPGNDALSGAGGKDTLVGDSGNDHLTGGRGNDLLAEGTGAPGDDIVDAGLGTFDTMSFADTERGVTLDLATGQNVGFGTDVITGVESWRGSGFDDRMIGTPGNDTFDAGPGGNDHLVGGDGNDKLWSLADRGNTVIQGGAGDDNVLVWHGGSVVAGSGNDRVRGNDLKRVELGPGNDFASINHVDHPKRALQVKGGGGRDLLEVTPSIKAISDSYHGGPGIDLLAVPVYGPRGMFIVPRGVAFADGAKWFHFGGFERLAGTLRDDTLIGGPEADDFYGGYGRDVLRGGGGRDVLDGGPNRDLAVGGTGRDACSAEVERSCERPLSRTTASRSLGHG
jgi:Ca2+-binding RTX toxin-like protein